MTLNLASTLPGWTLVDILGKCCIISQSDLVALLGKCSIITFSGLVDILACAFSKMELYDGHTEEIRCCQVWIYIVGHLVDHVVNICGNSGGSFFQQKKPGKPRDPWVTSLYGMSNMIGQYSKTICRHGIELNRRATWVGTFQVYCVHYAGSDYWFSCYFSGQSIV